MTDQLTINPRRFSANCSILFTELPVLERPAAARAAGFAAVEFWWPFDKAVPPAREVQAFADAVADANVQLASLNTYGGDLPSGDRGIASWPDRTREFLANLEIAIPLAERLNCTVLNVLYGRRMPGADGAEQADVAADNLAHAARAAAVIDATVVIEPLSAVADFPLRTAADVVAVIDRVGEPNVGLLADLYHLSVNGDDVHSVISRHADRIAHVQLADAPGRIEPGRGRLPIGDYLHELIAAGYGGRIGLEYVPEVATNASLQWWAGLRSRNEQST